MIQLCALDIISGISELNDHTTIYNLSALIQKGEDLEASWLTAQCSNLWRMAGPLHFRVMHCYPNHIQIAPAFRKYKKCNATCTTEFGQNVTFQCLVHNVKGASSSNFRFITMNTKSYSVKDEIGVFMEMYW